MAIIGNEPVISDILRVYRGLKTDLESKHGGEDVTVEIIGSALENPATVTAPLHETNPLALVL